MTQRRPHYVLPEEPGLVALNLNLGLNLAILGLLIAINITNDNTLPLPGIGTLLAEQGLFVNNPLLSFLYGTSQFLLGLFFIWLVLRALASLVLYLPRLQFWLKQDTRRQMTVRVGQLPPQTNTTSHATLPLPFSLTENLNHDSYYINGVLYILITFVFVIFNYQHWLAVFSFRLSLWSLFGFLFHTLFITALLARASYLLYFKKATTLTATTTHLTLKISRTTITIPWHEARLFALINANYQDHKNPRLFSYELSSENHTIRWSFTTYAPTDPEQLKTYDEHMQKFIATISTLTHLPIHDLRL